MGIEWAITNRQIDSLGTQVHDFLRGMDGHYDVWIDRVELRQSRHQPSLRERARGGQLNGIPLLWRTDQGKRLGNLVKTVS
ncbi:hypothetical protein D3C79_1072640 [compost metagenome]